MNYSISFDPDIRWKNTYRRNNKTKESKHILCFPDHNSAGHSPSKFCGRSIKINTICPNTSKILVCGNFTQVDNESRVYLINDLISSSSLRKTKNSKCPLYFGEEIDPYTVYEINAELKAWVMNIPLTKLPQLYTFCVYLLVESNIPDSFLCVSSIQSPPFYIVSARRHSDNKEIEIKIPPISLLSQPLYSPVKCEKEINNEKLPQSSNIIKPKKHQNSFKFDNIMPHIYDEDNFKSSINNSVKNVKVNNNNNKVIEREVESIEAMKKAMDDLMLYEPNTVYKVKTKKGQIEATIVDKTNISVEREELTHYGEKVEDLYKNNGGYEYLDKFGNKCVMYFGCFSKDDEEVK